MAARVPVISTNAGGLKEINIHGTTGYTAKVGDVASMSEFAIGLLGNEDDLAKMKEQAFQQAMKFDIQNIVPQYEKLYSRFCRLEPCA
jgi:glycosyltransferase involved in cell wall biosynthesis